MVGGVCALQVAQAGRRRLRGRLRRGAQREPVGAGTLEPVVGVMIRRSVLMRGRGRQLDQETQLQYVVRLLVLLLLLLRRRVVGNVVCARFSQLATAALEVRRAPALLRLALRTAREKRAGASSWRKQQRASLACSLVARAARLINPPALRSGARRLSTPAWRLLARCRLRHTAVGNAARPGTVGPGNEPSRQRHDSASALRPDSGAPRHGDARILPRTCGCEEARYCSQHCAAAMRLHRQLACLQSRQKLCIRRPRRRRRCFGTCCRRAACAPTRATRASTLCCATSRRRARATAAAAAARATWRAGRATRRRASSRRFMSARPTPTRTRRTSMR